MRIVLDESVPEDVAVYLLEHEVKNLREFEAAVKELKPGQITKVECGTFVPKKFRKPDAPSA